jgi:uncharacterized protein YndB with AHSA1/START domain
VGYGCRPVEVLKEIVMAKGYAVERDIDAEPQRVWELLTDGPAYPSWNPAVLSFEGRIAVREKITFVSVVNPKRSFTVTVSALEVPNRMEWSDGMPLGLFRGVRTFTVGPRPGGGAVFTMREDFSGPLAPLITKAIPDMTDSFRLFADGLKRAAEGAAA